MKNILKTVSALGILALFTFSCQEDEIPQYSGPNAINIYAKVDNMSGSGYTTSDSLVMSFLAYPATYTEHRFDLLLRLMGQVSDKPRTVKLGFGEEQTAVLGTDFTMDTEVTFPAGAMEIVIPVTAHYHSGLEAEVTVNVVVEESGDFIPAIQREVKFRFSAQFPSGWYASSGDLGYTGSKLGACERAKYEVYYQVEGTIDLAKYAVGWFDYGPGDALIFKLNAYIDEYNSQFGDDETKWLKDKNGNNLRF